MRLPAPLRSRRFWWGVAGLLAIAALACWLALRSLAGWLWPDTRFQQLLARAEMALAQGRLSATDGSGARELFEAALALDGDRDEARVGLVRTGQAALARAGAALAAGRIDEAAQALRLAQLVQMPQAQIQPLLQRLERQRAAGAGLDALLDQAAQARQQGRLDGGADSALPLYQRALQLAPDHTAALEGREDALSDVVQRIGQRLDEGDLVAAATLLATVRSYDPGHVGLPAAQDEFSRRLEQRRLEGERQLRRGRLTQAARSFVVVSQAQPEDAAARDGLARVATALAVQASREAADFRFDAAEATLAQARELLPSSEAVATAERALLRSRQIDAQQRPQLSASQREQQLRRLLRQAAQAEAARHWLTPPGASAYDRLREAQAIAAHDRRVIGAVRRVLASTRACFEQELSDNRLRAARVCLDAWQMLAGREADLTQARRRLAQGWLAVGSERLDLGDVGFAAQALQQAGELDPASAELPAFRQRLRAATLRP